MRQLQLLRVHKNIKAKYYLRNLLRYYLYPNALFRAQLSRKLTAYSTHPDREDMDRRVAYYNKLEHPVRLEGGTRIRDFRFSPKAKMKVYFFDAYEITRYFNPELRCAFLFGDITHIPPVPSITKSRPIAGENGYSVVLKLEKDRHFTWIKDPIPFAEKENRVIFRGKVAGKPHRERFLEQYKNHPLCDLADVSRHVPDAKKKMMTLRQHLNAKFIMAIEGNDVASNLKWVMSSNCIAVMPRPTYETWFMEGTLIPNVHYIEIKADYSDLIERISYYIDHPEEAQKIIDQANAYCRQFMDERREELIQIKVLEKYFAMTQQR